MKTKLFLLTLLTLTMPYPSYSANYIDGQIWAANLCINGISGEEFYRLYQNETVQKTPYRIKPITMQKGKTTSLKLKTIDKSKQFKGKWSEKRLYIGDDINFVNCTYVYDKEKNYYLEARILIKLDDLRKY